jgi:phospholipid transport system substrate-binding protein
MKKLLLAFALCIAAAWAAAQDKAPGVLDAAPDNLVRNITDEVNGIIKQDKDIQAGDPRKIAALIETKILPHFQLERMTQLAVGRNWRIATPEQQKLLTTEFMTLLVRTYSTALTAYRDQVVNVKPLRAAAGATDVTVHAEVKQSGQQPIAIDYDLEKTSDGWKVYDVKVGGVSLVTTYRETFANEVRDHGVDGLIQSLANKNRQSDAKFGGSKT